jgi:hypothetical protein
VERIGSEHIDLSSVCMSLVHLFQHLHRFKLFPRLVEVVFSRSTAQARNEALLTASHSFIGEQALDLMRIFKAHGAVWASSPLLKRAVQIMLTGRFQSCLSSGDEVWTCGCFVLAVLKLGFCS